MVNREISAHLATTLRHERLINRDLIAGSEGVFYVIIDTGSRAQTPQRWVRESITQVVKDSVLRN
jgi:hypothetical protein